MLVNIIIDYLLPFYSILVLSPNAHFTTETSIAGNIIVCVGAPSYSNSTLINTPSLSYNEDISKSYSSVTARYSEEKFSPDSPKSIKYS